MDIFESLENLNVSEECFDDIVGLVEEYINEVSDEFAKAANVETTKRYNDAKNAVDALKAQIKNGKKGFYTDEEIKDLKKDLKDKEVALKVAQRNRIRDNHNQLNRDIRLGKF